MQPLYFLITTAGNDPNSICYEIHQKALDIQAGRKIDPTFYSVIYGADESEDWTDPVGNIKADKEKSTEKIDGAVAAIMALDRAIRCGNVNTKSVYDGRGILFL